MMVYFEARIIRMISIYYLLKAKDLCSLSG